MNTPISIPGAVSLLLTELCTLRKPEGTAPPGPPADDPLAGRLSVTIGGTVNFPALTRSVHTKIPTMLALPTDTRELPVMLTRIIENEREIEGFRQSVEFRELHQEFLFAAFGLFLTGILIRGARV